MKDPIIFDNAGQPITACCKATPVLYLNGAASCVKCAAYYSGVFLTGRFPSLVSKSPADVAGQNANARYGAKAPSGATREAKAPPVRKPIAGQKEFPI